MGITVPSLGAPRHAMAAGSYYVPQLSTIDGSGGLGNNLEYVVRFVMGASPTNSVDRIGIDVTGAGEAGCTIRLGIRSAVNSLPGDLIADYGPVAADTVGYKELTIAQTLVPGTSYWLCAAVRGAPVTVPTVRTRQIDPTLPLAAGTSGNVSGMFQDSTGVTIATPWTGGVATTETGPRIMVRAA